MRKKDLGGMTEMDLFYERERANLRARIAALEDEVKEESETTAYRMNELREEQLEHEISIESLVAAEEKLKIAKRALDDIGNLVLLFNPTDYEAAFQRIAKAALEKIK